jgi:hypothetical protein
VEKTIPLQTMTCVCFFFALLGQAAYPSTIATAEVQADFDGQQCSQSSAGAFVRCAFYDPNNLNNLVAQATADATASLFSVFAEATAENNGSATASGNSSATFDELVVAGGSGPSILIGHYQVSFSSATSGQFNATVSQGDGQLQIQYGSAGGMRDVMSDYTPGVPFEVTMSAHFFASAPLQSYGFIGVDLVNFTDQNGNPVSVTPIPEPGSRPIFGLILGVLAFLKSNRRATS